MASPPSAWRADLSNTNQSNTQAMSCRSSENVVLTMYWEYSQIRLNWKHRNLSLRLFNSRGKSVKLATARRLWKSSKWTYQG
jgi:hypothetical protein